ncbi:extracellular solute-binding protein [Tessaracoccus aquimaris]|nr:extracellular solute-binding protein [Tessaracoccus aquimaris]
MVNAIAGGKNAAEAEWIESYVIPKFVEAQKAKGVEVDVKFEPQGVDDEDYKTKIALDLSSKKGADVLGIDGIWTGEFAQAGYIKPLNQVAKDADSWDGWEQMTDAVQQALSFDGERYGVPQGSDGRVIYYNKTLFEKAGLPTDWQPTSWDEILEAGRALKKVDGVTPIQLNAGTAMGEATSMQGYLPMLMGTNQKLWADGKWYGDTQGMRDVLGLYKTIYIDEGLGDPILQQEASGRDTSFAEFAAGKIGILFEGDYFWRSVINPAEGVGTAPMADRDTVVGYAKIPAMKPGSGINGQDFVSMSGGTGRVLNPNSKNPDLAWELLAFMNSPEAFEARAAGTLSISPRKDVNDKLLASDKMLTFVNTEVLPITAYRPGLAEYPEVSAKLQQATLDVVSGTSPEDAAKSFADALPSIVGGEDNIAQG